MKILPGVTQPWRAQIARRHTPQPSGYWRYRPCLRWEFGFTCAFCLLHEVDFAPLGVERLGVMQIEHFTPQSLDPALRDLYGNCFYICRLCNRARQNAPNRDPRGRGKLLNPCERSWSDAFTVVNDELLPRDSSDPDAAYTWEAYDLSDPNKTMRRRNRREAIEKRRAFLGWARDAELKLQDLALASGEKAHPRPITRAWPRRADNLPVTQHGLVLSDRTERHLVGLRNRVANAQAVAERRARRNASAVDNDGHVVGLVQTQVARTLRVLGQRHGLVILSLDRASSLSLNIMPSSIMLACIMFFVNR